MGRTNVDTAKAPAVGANTGLASGPTLKRSASSVSGNSTRSPSPGCAGKVKRRRKRALADIEFPNPQEVSVEQTLVIYLIGLTKPPALTTLPQTAHVDIYLETHSTSQKNYSWQAKIEKAQTHSDSNSHKNSFIP